MRILLLPIFLLFWSMFTEGATQGVDDPHSKMAHQFAVALSKGDFKAAHQLLSAAAKKEFSPAALRKHYTEMTAYGSGPATHVEVMQKETAWPDKGKNDVAWIYVSIANNSFSEAVTLIVSREANRELISSIEWGRP